jgi:hypothetical protein
MARSDHGQRGPRQRIDKFGVKFLLIWREIHAHSVINESTNVPQTQAGPTLRLFRGTLSSASVQ